jgi:hypothetical protein
MIIEDEREVDPNERFEYGGENMVPSYEHNPDLDKFIATHTKIRDHEIYHQLQDDLVEHHQLQEDLVEHLWQHHPDEY